MSGQQEPRRLPVVEANEQIDRAHRYLDLHAIKRVDEHGPDTLTGRIVELAEAAVLRAEEAERVVEIKAKLSRSLADDLHATTVRAAQAEDYVRTLQSVRDGFRDALDDWRQRVRSLEDAQAYAQGIVRRAIAGKLVDTYEWQRILDGYAPADAALAAGFPEDGSTQLASSDLALKSFAEELTAVTSADDAYALAERLTEYGDRLAAQTSGEECA
jgi:hypothetical protein